MSSLGNKVTIILTMLVLWLCGFSISRGENIDSQTTTSKKLWSLEECIDYALENNIKIKMQESEIKISKLDHINSILHIAPEIRLIGEHNLNWGRSVNIQDLEIVENRLSQLNSAALCGEITIFDGLQRERNIIGNRLAREIEIAEYEELKNNIIIEITKSYLQLLLNKKILEAKSSNLEGTISQRERTATLVEVGEQSYGALLDMEAQLAWERVEVATAQSSVDMEKLSLMQLLNLNHETPFEIIEPQYGETLKGISIGYESVTDIASSLPELRIKELECQVYKNQIGMAIGALMPRVTLNGSLNTFVNDYHTNNIFQRMKSNLNPTVGVSIAIPIFSKSGNYLSVKRARIAFNRAKYSLAERNQELVSKLQRVVTDAEGYYRQYIAAEENLKAMSESFRITSEKFNNGIVSSTDYIVSKNNLHEAQANFLQIKYQYIFQVKIIEFYENINNKKLGERYEKRER